jgi:hypothetical protein
VTSIESQSKDSSVTSDGSGKTVVSRSLSDTSTISAKSDNNSSIAVNRSLDSAAIKHNQLLKLSFYNSPNSPMKTEAKKIAKNLKEPGLQTSFEDLNNVTPDLVDTSTDSVICDDDLKNFQVKTYDTKPTSTPSSKIAEFQEKLNKIKKEVDWDEVIDLSVDVKEERVSPKAIKTEKTDDQPEKTGKDESDNASELDAIYSKFKSVLSTGNKDEAKKQLAKLNEMLGTNQEPKNTLTVQPIIRQGTFEIDPKTGNKKVASEEPKAVETSDELMEKLALLFKNQTLDVRSMGDATGAKIVVVVPSMSSTPQKNSMQSISAIRHKSAFKATDVKRFTPTKTATRPGTSKTATKPPNPYEQKLAAPPSRAGSVRKSLLNSIDKGPQVPKTPAPRQPPVRRSVSMKASIPQVQVSKTSPETGTHVRPSPATPRPSTGAATPRPSIGAGTPRPSVGSTRKTSSVNFVKPSTPAPPSKPATSKAPAGAKPRLSARASGQFKAPANLRKTPVTDKSSLV